MNWAYLAGLVDGNRNITLFGMANRKTVRISSTNKKALLEIIKFLEQESIPSHLWKTKTTNYCCIYCCKDVIVFIEKILPYLVFKKELAKKTLAEIKHRRWYFHDPNLKVMRHWNGIVEEYSNGLSLADLGRKYKIHSATISYYLKKKGLLRSPIETKYIRLKQII